MGTTTSSLSCLRNTAHNSNKVWLAFLVEQFGEGSNRKSQVVTAWGAYGGTLSVQWGVMCTNRYAIAREAYNQASKKAESGYHYFALVDIPRYGELLELINDYGLQPIGFRTALYKDKPAAKLKPKSTESTLAGSPANEAKENTPVTIPAQKPAGRVGIELELDLDELGI